MPWIALLLLLVSCGQKNTDLPLTLTFRPNQSCSKSCFNDYRALKGKVDNRDYLAFANFGYKGIGRCRGHAIISQMLSELAIFDGKKERCLDGSTATSCLDIYRQQVKNIMQGNVEVIEGFENLYEFSKHPEIQNLLKQYIRSFSHRFNASKIPLPPHHYENDDVAIFYELLQRVKLNQRPYVGIRGINIGDHAVLVHDHSFNSHGNILCVHDSNIILHDGPDHCHNYFYVQEGKIMYQRYQKGSTELFVLSLTQDENIRVAKYIQARYNYCQQQKNC
jgi:hypothetical protein